ncbi:MAG: deoxyribodipyrimidine photo-lyase [Pseudomonadota bacterium]
MISPVLYWVRRDFRLADNPALCAAAASGRPVIPVFILDEVAERHGACPKWRLGLGAEAFARSLEGLGSRLIFRRGRAMDVLDELLDETNAESVVWTRAYDPDSVARDTAVKAALKARSIGADSHKGHVLFEPWDVKTGQGGLYRVYTPFWKAVKDREIAGPLAAPDHLAPPASWPKSDDPAAWNLALAMDRGAEVVAQHLCVGEAAARDRLDAFIQTRIDLYKARRDYPADGATSRLSENLTYGEISPRLCWHAGQRAMAEGRAGAEHFLREIVWREFAYHLVFHTPEITTRNWREGWDSFPWNRDATTPDVRRWREGRTGIRFVDAAMREMYVTGHMHNRARMIVGSFLTKHLMSHWKIGLDWFADCLADWDPASNAMGWQWVAGSGPDAAPYFRVFNPETQLEKFDADGAYARAWIAEGQSEPPKTASDDFRAVPLAWDLDALAAYPEPVITVAAGRKRALAAYEARDF